MSQDIAIETRQLRMVFGRGAQKVVALNNVDLSLSPGEFTLLMGPSGSGKSSLVSNISGLQKPTSGQVTALGEKIWDLSPSRLNKFRRLNCGFVFQSGGLFLALTALEQIILPLTYMGTGKREARKRAEQALDEVGLLQRSFSRPLEMSGGENQRIAIARMLSKAPRLIFCDEPTSALDRSNGERVAKLLRKSARVHNAMVLCVTHDSRLQGYADRLIGIEDGILNSDRKNRIAA